MATTSTSDSTPWTSRRVRDRRVVAGGAWLTITIIPSNAQFEHRLGPDRSVKIGRVVWPRHWWWIRRRRTDRTPSCLGHGGGRRPGCPVRHTAKRDLPSVGYQVAGSHGQDDVAEGVQDQFGLLMLDVVAALGRDYQPAAGDQLGELALELPPERLFEFDVRWGRVVGVTVGQDDQGHRPDRGAAQRHPGLAFAGPDVDSLRIDQPVGHGDHP